MSRPIIKIPLRTIDCVLEVVAPLMLTGMFIMIAEGAATGLGNLFLPIALIAIFSVLVLGIIRMNSK